MELQGRSPVILSLLSEFGQLSHALGAAEATVQKWSGALVARYTEPQRHYHTVEHIRAMIMCLNKYRGMIQDDTVVRLAIFFHDWIYDPKGKENEMESIQCFKDFAAETGLSESIIFRVTEYIKRTISHTVEAGQEADGDLCLFLDFDLEVLARDDTAYLLYAAQIRQEYGHVTADAYVEGRSKVLQSFLQRERLYFSDVFHEIYEARARENIQHEIAQMSSSIA